LLVAGLTCAAGRRVDLSFVRLLTCHHAQKHHSAYNLLLHLFLKQLGCSVVHHSAGTTLTSYLFSHCHTSLLLLLLLWLAGQL
jgi:hypothetical protein